MNILIVEDRVEEIYIYKKAIKNVDQDVLIFTAASEAEALKILKKEKIDFFILDVQLEGNSSGFDLAKKIRERYEYSRTPVMFATGDAQDKIRATEYKYCSYLVKPFTAKQMESEIKLLLKLTREKIEKTIILTDRWNTIEVRLSEIIYVESKLHNAEIMFTDRSIKVRKKLADLLPQLDERFLQCHRSFIVNLDYFKRYDISNSLFELNNVKKKVPIGKRYRSAVVHALISSK